MARHIDAYEHLRCAVLRAQARPEGLAAVAYHGLLGGLEVLCAVAVPASTPLPACAAAQGAASTTDPVLVRLLAYMVLFYQEEVNHVV